MEDSKNDRFDEEEHTDDSDGNEHADPAARDLLNNGEPIDDGELLDDLGEFEFSLDKLSSAYAQVLEQQQESKVAASRLQSPTDAEGAGGEVASSESATSDFESEARDNAPCPLNETTVLEALLFVGTPPDQRFTPKKLAALLRDVSPKEVKQIVEQLNQDYEQQGSAIRFYTESGAIRMDLAPEMAVWKNKFLGEVRETELTQHAIDVLAIVAYNQPVSKKEIDAIRQRPSGAILAQLMQRQLLESITDDGSHKQSTYRTTGRFLELFGLDQLGDLPHVQEVDNIDDFFD